MNELIKKVNLTRQDVLHGSYEYLNSHRLIHQLYSTKLFTGNKTCMLVAKLSNYVTHTHFTPDEYVNLIINHHHQFIGSKTRQSDKL